MGIITPVTLQGKVLFQQAWNGNLDWDDPIDKGNAEVSAVEKGLKFLEHSENCRLIGKGIHTLGFGDKELHIFCDVSELPFGACIYIRTKHEGQIHTSLLT